ncbi:M20/M25/M40 family metallo-hydrolase [Nostoc sp. XA010]|uniref:M20/M25/M40 family metallo-hydrolase n=1 Tax=Nostoc sp. XA010 TaxID=2780407 RepID=UPI001E48F370|nr:M20/M25/M40 family metallo-hydrolase [Nostoc sp. XA010]MCC5661298.1 M20/M25/M40 family metallo-hydrolase [Nostoc sp. XA010]
MKNIAFVTFLFILCLVFLGIYQLDPPAAVSVSAPLVEFSSSRAIKHLEVIAKKPHPIGSAASAEVRNYIVQQLTTLGVKPEVQTTSVINEKWGTPFVAGNVANVIAKLEGTDRTKAVLFAAHYDSIAQGVGASDNGTAVVAMLENIRALKAGSPLKNDVIFLFTDGEESGLLGAKAFVDQHPFAKDVEVAFNFEARGNSGSSVMFETSDQNGWVIQEFAKAAVHPIGNSIFYTIYKILPNDTDLSIFKKAGWSALNFAYLKGFNYYHTFVDNLKNVDERSLQHQGEYILALSRHFGNLNLENTKDSDAIYFDILGLTLIHYPEAWVPPLTIFVTAFFVMVIMLGLKRRQLTIGGIILGFFAFLFTIFIASATVTLAWWVITTVHSGYQVFAQGDTYNSNFYLVGFVALTIAITSSLYTLFSKKISISNLAVAALLGWLILMIITSLFLPGTSYFFTFPLLFTLVGWGLIFAIEPITRLPKTVSDDSKKRINMGVRVTILSVCAIPGIILLTPTIYIIFLALTLSMSGAIAVLVGLQLGLLIPYITLFRNGNKFLLSRFALLISLGFIFAGSLTADFTAKYPKPNSILYGLNADTGKAIWASLDQKPDEWTSQFLSQNPQKVTLTEYLPTVSWQFLQNSASVVSLSPPDIQLLKDNVENSTRTVHLQITSPRKARILRVYADTKTEILEAAVNGKKIDINHTHNNTQNAWGLDYFAIPPEGIELTLSIKRSQPLKLKAVDQSEGLPKIPGKFTSRPNYMMPTAFGGGVSNSTLVSKSFTF